MKRGPFKEKVDSNIIFNKGLWCHKGLGTLIQAFSHFKIESDTSAFLSLALCLSIVSFLSRKYLTFKSANGLNILTSYNQYYQSKHFQNYFMDLWEWDIVVAACLCLMLLLSLQNQPTMPLPQCQFSHFYLLSWGFQCNSHLTEINLEAMSVLVKLCELKPKTNNPKNVWKTFNSNLLCTLTSSIYHHKAACWKLQTFLCWLLCIL